MLKFWLKSPLFEEAGEGTGAGGGNGAGAGNSGAGNPDLAAFKAEIMGEFDTKLNKTINGFGKSFKTDLQKMFEGLKPAAAVAGEGAGAGSGEGATAGKGVDPEKNALQLEIKKLRADSEARIRALEDSKTASEKKAEEMERDGALRDVLGKYDFMSPEAKNTAFHLFKSQVQRADDGSLVAGDLPLDKFIESELPAKHAYLVKGKDVSGAGARPGKGPGGKKWDLDVVLKPENFSKLSPAEQADVRQAIAQSL